MPTTATASPGSRPSLQERLRQKIRAKEAARHPRKHDDHAFRAFLTAAGVKPGKQKQRKPVPQDVTMAAPMLPYIYQLGSAPCFLPPPEPVFVRDSGLFAVTDGMKSRQAKVDDRLETQTVEEISAKTSSQSHSSQQIDRDCLASSGTNGQKTEADLEKPVEKQVGPLPGTDHLPPNEVDCPTNSNSPLPEEDPNIVNIQKQDDEEKVDISPTLVEQPSRESLFEVCERFDSPESSERGSEDQTELPDAIQVLGNLGFEDEDQVQTKSLQHLGQEALGLDKVSVSTSCREGYKGKASRRLGRRKGAELRADPCNRPVKNPSITSPPSRIVKADQADITADCVRPEKTRLPSISEGNEHGRGTSSTSHKARENRRGSRRNPVSSNSSPKARLKVDHRAQNDSQEGLKHTTTLVLCCDDSVWSEGSPLVNIFFRYDELGDEDSSAVTKEKCRTKKKRRRLGSDLTHL